MKARFVGAESVTATTHRLAHIIDRLIKHGQAYVRHRLKTYQQRFQIQKPRAVQEAAKNMGLKLVSEQTIPTGVA